MSSLVSIVIPNYNYAHFLKRALESVLAQTYPYWEAIVIDNHSDDNTDEIVSAQRDPRIRLAKIHNHGVIAASRNLGIRESKGEWVAFLDSDDCWYPKRLERVMLALESDSPCDVLCNDEMMVDITNGASRVLRCGPYQSDFYKALLVYGNRLSPSATVVRRDFLLRNGLTFNESPDYITVEDYDLWLQLARCGARFKFLNEVLGEYVIHQSNSSASVIRQTRNGEILLRDHVFKIQQFEASRERLWRQVAPRLRYSEVLQLAAAGRAGAATSLAVKTLMSSPIPTASYLLARLKKAARRLKW